MGMHPVEFFDCFVLWDFEDWKAEPQDLRKAFHVAVSAFHLADHYQQFYARQDSAFAGRYPRPAVLHKVLAERAPHFRVVQGVATAYKHLYTRTQCEVSSGGSLTFVERPEQSLGVDWTGRGVEGGLVVRLRGGATIPFEQAITQVLEMWSEILSGDGQPSL